mmetsp:Transcript_24582/g.38143  ORF Transcript_24582/g.38143 Transcript_24582/m.38143 type:complete len:262 (-) Transcript_24582:2286-3071(-)|eukprot:CAMPEP_0170483262 /NCGR_PEP_ID=MMETSP0208-20121228/2960_1 /TAXON_ID=197538 /ORGANISM="Strombidium inclinatum, Strain S3" /LENGTH=261 /DNA_ID=CAMNT_0010756223 /DNA_START=1434 /DNA_END=2219 /DNA_ORIENTATION=+
MKKKGSDQLKDFSNAYIKEEDVTQHRNKRRSKSPLDNPYASKNMPSHIRTSVDEKAEFVHKETAETKRAGSTKSRKIIKKIVKKRAYSICNSPTEIERVKKDPRSKSALKMINGRYVKNVETVYEITTTKIDKNGQRVFEKTEKIREKPTECKDLSNSMRLLQAIRKTEPEQYFNDGDSRLKSKMQSKFLDMHGHTVYSDVTDLSKYSKASGAGYLTKILNPRNFSSLKTLEVNNSQSNLYVETLPSEATTRRTKKKIVII